MWAYAEFPEQIIQAASRLVARRASVVASTSNCRSFINGSTARMLLMHLQQGLAADARSGDVVQSEEVADWILTAEAIDVAARVTAVQTVPPTPPVQPAVVPDVADAADAGVADEAIPRHDRDIVCLPKHRFKLLSLLFEGAEECTRKIRLHSGHASFKRALTSNALSHVASCFAASHLTKRKSPFDDVALCIASVLLIHLSATFNNQAIAVQD